MLALGSPSGASTADAGIVNLSSFAPNTFANTRAPPQRRAQNWVSSALYMLRGAPHDLFRASLFSFRSGSPFDSTAPSSDFGASAAPAAVRAGEGGEGEAGEIKLEAQPVHEASPPDSFADTETAEAAGPEAQHGGGTMVLSNSEEEVETVMEEAEAEEVEAEVEMEMEVEVDADAEPESESESESEAEAPEPDTSAGGSLGEGAAAEAEPKAGREGVVEEAEGLRLHLSDSNSTGYKYITRWRGAFRAFSGLAGGEPTWDPSTRRWRRLWPTRGRSERRRSRRRQRLDQPWRERQWLGQSPRQAHSARPLAAPASARAAGGA